MCPHPVVTGSALHRYHPGRELFVVVGSAELLERMTANDRQARRYSALRTRLLRETGREL